MSVSKTAIATTLATAMTLTAGVAFAGSCGSYSKGHGYGPAMGYGPGMGYGGPYARPPMAPPRPMLPPRAPMAPYGHHGNMPGPYADGYRMAPPAAAPTAGPAAAAQGSVASTAEPAASASVAITQMRFAAPTVTVKAGGTVTWTNNEGMPHTVTAADGSFGSQELGMGGTFTRTFDEPGTYTYYCKLHPNMRGTVVVVG